MPGIDPALTSALDEDYVAQERDYRHAQPLDNQHWPPKCFSVTNASLCCSFAGILQAVLGIPSRQRSWSMLHFSKTAHYRWHPRERKMTS